MSRLGRLEIPLEVGQEVSYFNPHQQMSVDVPKFSTIARVLKAVVVLEDGERFRRDGLDQQKGGTWGWYVYLFHRKDPKVAEQVQKYNDYARQVKAKNAAYRFGTGDVGPEDVIRAMAALLPDAQRSAIEEALR